MAHRDDTLDVAFAGLLTDQRVEAALSRFIPDTLQVYKREPARHIARRASELVSAGSSPPGNRPTHLVPILRQVELTSPTPVGVSQHHLTALDVSDSRTYPTSDPTAMRMSGRACRPN